MKQKNIDDLLSSTDLIEKMRDEMASMGMVGIKDEPDSDDIMHNVPVNNDMEAIALMTALAQIMEVADKHGMNQHDVEANMRIAMFPINDVLVAQEPEANTPLASMMLIHAFVRELDENIIRRETEPTSPPILMFKNYREVILGGIAQAYGREVSDAIARLVGIYEAKQA